MFDKGPLLKFFMCLSAMLANSSAVLTNQTALNFHRFDETTYGSWNGKHTLHRFADDKESVSTTKQPPNRFVFMSIIFKNDVYFVCAGSLISSYHVLTAAHCVVNNRYVRIQPNKLSVRFGYRTVGLNQLANPVVMWFTHPSYNPETREYDVAVLELRNKVEFSDTLAPVKLATDESKDSLNELVAGRADCVVFGWEPDLTQQRNLIFDKYYIQQKRVNLKWWKDSLEELTKVCAEQKEILDECRGDSGGPLICADGVQFGIATWNPGCHLPMTVQDVYTRVDLMSKFILLAMERQGKFWMDEIKPMRENEFIRDHQNSIGNEETLEKEEDVAINEASKYKFYTIVQLPLFVSITLNISR